MTQSQKNNAIILKALHIILIFGIIASLYGYINTTIEIIATESRIEEVLNTKEKLQNQMAKYENIYLGTIGSVDLDFAYELGFVDLNDAIFIDPEEYLTLKD